MNKEEFIAKYGEEAYNKNKQKIKDWKDANKEKYSQLVKEWADVNREKIRERHNNWQKSNREKTNEMARQRWASMTEEERKELYKHTKAYARERTQNDPVFKFKLLFSARKQKLKIVSPDEAMALVVKEAEECGCPELINMEYMVERFYDNCKYGLVYGNLEILRYFYKLMQIKVAKNERFTDSEKEMICYFRNLKVDTRKNVRLYFNNNWVIDVANVDMAYVDDMARNAKGLDLLLTEEKYNELKGLT